MDVLVGAAMIGAMVLAVSKMMGSAGETSKKVDIKLEIAEFGKHINRLIGSEAACTRSLAGISATNGPVSTLYGYDREGNEFVALDSNMEYGPMHLKVESMRLIDAPGTDDGVQVQSGETGTTNLELKFAFRPGSVYDGRDIRSKVKLGVQTNSSGRVVSCFSVNEGGVSIWKRVVGTPSDIYYNEGQVGIGTNTPSTLFDISGFVSAKTDSGNKLILGGGSGFQIGLETAGPLELFVAPTAKRADLVPGDVILDGLLHLSNSTAPCSNTNRGAVRYNSGQVQVCELTGWVNKKRGPTFEGYQGSPYGSIPSTHTGCSIRTTRHSMDGSSC